MTSTQESKKYLKYQKNKKSKKSRKKSKTLYYILKNAINKEQKIIECPKDGNCFYNALLFAIILTKIKTGYNIPKNITDFRLFLSKYVKHKLKYSTFLDTNQKNEFIENIKKNKLWGEDGEMRLISAALNIQFIFKDIESGQKNYIKPLDITIYLDKDSIFPCYQSPTRKVCLLYHKNMHFDLYVKKIYIDKEKLKKVFNL